MTEDAGASPTAPPSAPGASPAAATGGPAAATGAPVHAPADVPIPFLNRPENIVRYEEGVVLVLDRRVYPFKRTFVRCDTHEEVARAIESMVTQSLGPGPTAGYGLAQAARGAGVLARDRREAVLRAAAARLIATRPTNNQVRLVVGAMLRVALEAVASDADPEAAIVAAMDDHWARHLADSRAVGRAGAGLIRDGDRLLTHCWADAPLVHVLREARLAGRSFEVTCTETRPYLQGARLTADAVAELGAPVTLVTDGMPAALMAAGRVDRFLAGADRVTMDGHWVNKVGTLGIAIAAARYRVPAYGVTYAPDPDAPNSSAVVIEERDPEEVTHVLGRRSAAASAVGYYPAFDVTPPELTTGFVFDRGVFSPGRVVDYFDARSGPTAGPT